MAWESKEEEQLQGSPDLSQTGSGVLGYNNGCQPFLQKETYEYSRKETPKKEN